MGVSAATSRSLCLVLNLYRGSSRLPHQPYSDVMTNLTLRPCWATRLVGCVPGVKPRAESLNRFAVNPTDSWAKSSYAFGVADLSPLTTVSGVISETPCLVRW